MQGLGAVSDGESTEYSRRLVKELRVSGQAKGPVSIKKWHVDRVAPAAFNSFDPMQAPSKKTVTPVDCPFCASTDVVTAADVKGKATVKDADRYWRCGACGEVWNPGRARGGCER
jgi:hypothetical protein